MVIPNTSTSSAPVMLLITRHSDKRTRVLKLPCGTFASLPREYLMMGDDRSDPTSYISQCDPVKVYHNAGTLSLTNKQKFLLCRDSDVREHNNVMSNIQASDGICFCPERIIGRDHATFSFTLTTNPEGLGLAKEEDDERSEESEEDLVLRSYFLHGKATSDGEPEGAEAADLRETSAGTTPGEWRKRKLPVTFTSQSSSSTRKSTQ